MMNYLNRIPMTNLDIIGHIRSLYTSIFLDMPENLLQLLSVGNNTLKKGTQ